MQRSALPLDRQLNKDFTNLLRFAGFDLKSYRQCLTKWNAAISAMNDECKALGPKHCLPVIYEQMVLHPEQWLRKISNFLEVPWNDAVLHHEEQINKKGGISLSKVESLEKISLIFPTSSWVTMLLP